MGQKVSSSHSSSEVSLSKKDSRDPKLKTKKFANWSREKINVDFQQQNVKNTFADSKKLKNDINNDDNDENEKTTHNDYSTLAYPSIAELSNFTALNMMRNLEDVEALRNQVNEANEILMDDEKCFNTINYEETSMVELDDNSSLSLRQDSSTCTTNEINEELCQDSLVEDVDDVEEKLSCKDSEQNVLVLIEDEEEEEEEEEDEEEDEMMMEKSETLEAKLQRVERERDEAMSKLKLVEVKCEAYEEESKCLEATMESMEEKLRTIVTELRDEVAKSKDLEQKLSSSYETFQNSVDLASCENLISHEAKVHS